MGVDSTACRIGVQPSSVGEPRGRRASGGRSALDLPAPQRIDQPGGPVSRGGLSRQSQTPDSARSLDVGRTGAIDSGPHRAPASDVVPNEVRISKILK